MCAKYECFARRGGKTRWWPLTSLTSRGFNLTIKGLISGSGWKLSVVDVLRFI